MPLASGHQISRVLKTRPRPFLEMPFNKFLEKSKTFPSKGGEREAMRRIASGDSRAAC